MKYEDVKLQPAPGKKFIVLESISYKDIVIPKYFATNGADVPRLFWFLYPPNKPDYLPAVLVHDYLCNLEQYEKADKYFEEILISLGIRKINIFLLVGAVRIYHKIRYKGINK